MVESKQVPESNSPAKSSLQTTSALLDQIRRGDDVAKDRLVRRFLPGLRQWARGRLPTHARDFTDTDDLVQVTLLKALDKVEDFENRREGSFLAYLRKILLNQIRDQIRRAQRRPRVEAMEDNLPAPGPSPLEAAIGTEAIERYERALPHLTAEQQDAVILRIELGLTHGEIAEATGSPSANAARMLVTRGLIRLVEVMNESR